MENCIAKEYSSHHLIKPEWLNQVGSTSFLTKCRNGTINLDELHVFVKQQQVYSRHFARYLAALLSNIEDGEDRFELTKNLFDEMGLSESDVVTHVEMYQKMMDKMGVVSDKTALPSTQKLIDDMFQCCRSENYMVGLGALCLGAEAIVPYFYSILVNAFLALGEPIENLEFFTLHIQCDDEHSSTMFKIIEAELTKNPGAMIDLEYGAAKTIQARVDFFNGLLM